MRKLYLIAALLICSGAFLSSCGLGEKCPAYRNGKLK